MELARQADCIRRDTRSAVIAFTCCCLAGCGTVENLSAGPVVMGGTRNIFLKRRDLEGFSFALMDSPFSLALDTALLPVTGIFEIIRWLSGWPPSPGY
jgi:uncharacterized protein YceK